MTYLFATQISDPAVQYPFVVMTALLNIFMVTWLRSEKDRNDNRDNDSLIKQYVEPEAVS